MFKNIGVDNADRENFQGENIIVPNSKIGYLRNLKLYGKSVQDGEPTPDNPVPIQNVPSSFDINSCGVNLIPNLTGTFVHMQTGTTSQANGVISGTGMQPQPPSNTAAYYHGQWHSSDIWDYLPDGEFTFSFKVAKYSDYAIPDTAVGNGILVGIFYGGGAYLPSLKIYDVTSWATGEFQNINITFTKPPVKDTLRILFWFGGKEMTFKDLQIGLGSTATDYVPYTATVVPFAVRDTNNNLHELSSVQDGTSNEVALQSGKIIKKVKTKSFSINSLSYETGTRDTIRVMFSDWDNKSNNHSEHGNVRCNIAQASKFWHIPYHVTVQNSVSYTRFIIFIPTADLTNNGFTLDSAGMKNYLKSLLGEEGTVTFYYPYSDNNTTDQTVFDLHPDETAKLKQLKSVYPQTTIFTSAAVQPILSLNAISYGE